MIAESTERRPEAHQDGKGIAIVLDVLPHELVLTFLAGLLTGVLFAEGIVRPRRTKRALIWRRLAAGR
jgi:hypothetical protein